jgi:hypothetical protein
MLRTDHGNYAATKNTVLMLTAFFDIRTLCSDFFPSISQTSLATPERGHWM